MLWFPGKMRIKPNRKSAPFGCRELVKRVMTADFCMSTTKISCHLVGSFRKMAIVKREMSAFLSTKGLLRIPTFRSQAWPMALSHVHTMRGAFAQRGLSVDFSSSIFSSKQINKCLVKVSSARIIRLDFVLLDLSASINILSWLLQMTKLAWKSLVIFQTVKTTYNNKLTFRNTVSVHSTKKFRFVIIVVKRGIKNRFAKKIILGKVSLTKSWSQTRWTAMWYASSASSMVIMPTTARGGSKDHTKSQSLRVCWVSGWRVTSPWKLKSTFSSSEIEKTKRNW